MSHKVHEEITLSTSARRLLLQIRKEWQNWRGTSGQIYFEDRIDQYRDIWKAIAAELETDQDQREIGGYIILFGWLSFFWFLAFFRHQLQIAEGEGGWLTSVAYGGGLVAAALILVAVALNFSTTAVSNYGPDNQVAKTLVVLGWNSIWVIAPPLIAFSTAASIIIVRFRALPRWIGWGGILPSVSLLMPWIG